MQPTLITPVGEGTSIRNFSTTRCATVACGFARQLRISEQQKGEFVSAKPCNKVRAPQQGLQLTGDVLKEGITALMAKGVIHLLKPVEIDEQ